MPSFRPSCSVLARFCLLGLLLMIAPDRSLAANFTRGAETARKFGVHEITLTGAIGGANPFDTVAQVVFTPPSGSARAVVVEAFHDGGDIWRARVYADEAGGWTWRSASSDPALDGKSGSFVCADSALRGKLKKHPADTKAWATDDGRWFLNLSDTAYYLFNDACLDWRSFVAQDAALGITSLRVSLAGALSQYGKQQASDGWDRIFADAGRTRLNLGAFQTNDERLAWMLDEHPEVYVQLIVAPAPDNGWGKDESFWAGLAPAQRTRFLRHVVARYGAWPQIFWLATNDAFHGSAYPNNNAMVSEIGAYLAANDPWKSKNLRSSGRNRDQTFYFTSASWASYAHLETTTALAADQVALYSAAPLHVYNGEDWYEGERAISDDAYFFRRLFWSWTLSGGSACYGGYWKTIVPYSDTGFTGLDDLRHLAAFFSQNGVELAGFVADDSRASGPAGARRVKLTRKADDSAFVFYHPNASADGGTAAPAAGTATFTVKVLPAAAYALTWWRADTGESVAANVFAHTGGDRAFTAPWPGVDVAGYLRAVPAETVPRLILDTDFRTDVDDVGTLAMIHGLQDRGLVELIGVGATTRGASVVAAIDAVNTFFGRPGIPVGVIDASLASDGSDAYAPTLAAGFPHDQATATAPDLVTLYRSLLATAPDGGVRIAVVGGQNGVNALLQSAAHHNGDAIALGGRELITSKVSELVVMGGRFDNASYAESNIKRGVAAAQAIAADWPTPIVYVGWEIGAGVLTGAALKNPAVNPVAKAYEVFWGSGGAGTIGDRDSWDQCAALHAVAGLAYEGRSLWTLSPPQTIAFAPGGQTLASPSAGSNRRYLLNEASDATVAALISDLMTGGSPGPPDPVVAEPRVYYTFDEAAGSADPGNPVANRGSLGPSIDLGDTGGPDGRDNKGVGGYSYSGYAGFGSAFDVLASGDGTYHSGNPGSAIGGGLATSAPVPQSSLQGADGAFTYEALVMLSDIAREQTILGHDGSARGFLFRVVGGQLSLYTGAVVVAASIPVSGPHAFAPGEWFHAAVSYDGAAGAPGNLRFYWTALDAEPAAANLIGVATLAADLDGSTTNRLGVGSTTRSPFRFELGGRVDEVRMSGTGLAGDAFSFVTPIMVHDTDGDGMPDDWENAHGLDSGSANANDDPDADGLPNLMEFALGLDPGLSEPVGLPVVTAEAGYLTLTATRNPLAADLVFEVEVANEPGSWMGGIENVVILDATPDRLKARDTMPLSATPRRFMRLKVSHPP